MEEEESRQCRKRKECDEDDQGCCLEKILAISDDEDEADDVERFKISEEAVAEMMRWLQHEIGLGGSPLPSPSQETTFAIINGNEESCGSSFSGPESTVMASIDTRGVACASCFIGGPSDRAPLFWPWPVSSVEDGGYWPEPVGTVGATAAAMEEDEEEWLARVLDEPGFDFEGLL
ncbi:hypothetical protein COCNU_03G015200 [Cocos nucifera]|uniref:Uncharacterized protein n=1 Tax=Cocos nucifera TaxID=13894 RepID=A0A8K0I4J4_COCNU|nr:hypothetical protein COCNU_03G015200 [Cocos nucifera]